jgi:hypothetical protein
VIFLRRLVLQGGGESWWQFASRCCWSRALRLKCFLSASVQEKTWNSAHEQTRHFNDTIDSVLRHGKLSRAEDLSAPPRIRRNLRKIANGVFPCVHIFPAILQIHFTETFRVLCGRLRGLSCYIEPITVLKWFSVKYHQNVKFVSQELAVYMNLIERTNKMQPYSRIYYSNVSYLLNMFRTTHRPPSGAQKL